MNPGGLGSSLPMKKASRVGRVGRMVGLQSRPKPILQGVLELAWPFRVVPNLGKGVRLLYLHMNPRLPPGAANSWGLTGTGGRKSWWCKQLGGYKAISPHAGGTSARVKRRSTQIVYHPWHRPGREMTTLTYRGHQVWQAVLSALITWTDLIHVMLLWGRGFLLTF